MNETDDRGPFEERKWVRQHVGGWLAVIHETDQGWFEGSIISRSGHVSRVGDGTSRSWVQTQVSQALESFGHSCTSECEPEIQVPVVDRGLSLE